MLTFDIKLRVFIISLHSKMDRFTKDEPTVSPMWVQEKVEKSSQSRRPNRGWVPDRRLKSTASTGVIFLCSNPLIGFYNTKKILSFRKCRHTVQNNLFAICSGTLFFNEL